MSPASILLRLVLMISLLLNGVNAAMAGNHTDSARAAATRQAAQAPAAGADCHRHMAEHEAAGPTQLSAAADEGHCRIKQCLRSCAQQPVLAVQPLRLPVGPALSLAPLPMPANGLPAPPLLRITRPPIG